MSLPADLLVRPVGFRAGGDEDLRALHTVESPVEAERRPDRAPQPLGSYIAFTRNLPSYFDDHAWLVEATDGTAVASAACWSNAAGDARVMECDLMVRRDRRHEGIGTRLLCAIGATTLEEGRSLLTWSTFDPVPAGATFSLRAGAAVARVNRTSELVLAQVDWAMVESWERAERARALGYSIEMVDGPYPVELRDDAARFHHIMQTTPRDGLDVGDVRIDAAAVAELDRTLVGTGRLRWTALVRDPAGVCIGGTEVTFESWDPTTAHQQNTGIDPHHRRLALAKWAKAAVLTRIRRERPEVRRVRTGNAFSNVAMLAINDRLGFKVISTRTEWQVAAADLLRSLSASR